MANERTYLDYNATAPVKPEVQHVMASVIGQCGNASSVHEEGRRARAEIEAARQKIATVFRASVEDIIFASGGTEANVTALSPNWEFKTEKSESPGTEKAPVTHCFVSAVEHPSVLKGGGFDEHVISTLRVTEDGVLDLSALAEDLETYRSREDGSFLASIMLANNETGAIQPVDEAAEIVHEFGGILHCDAVQAVGKIPLDLQLLKADLISLSAHKFGGPQGIGALIINRSDIVLKTPLMRGGGQEIKRRAGTENFVGIVGFGKAAELVSAELENITYIESLRDRFEEKIRSLAPEAVIFSGKTPRLPNTSCMAIPGLSSETTVIALDLAGFAISAGSACSSGKVERSHVLEAMGVGHELSRCAVRISLGWQSSKEDIDKFVEAISEIFHRHKSQHETAA